MEGRKEEARGVMRPGGDSSGQERGRGAERGGGERSVGERRREEWRREERNG